MSRSCATYARAHRAGQTALATDSIFPLDGRWGKERALDEAHRHFQMLNRNLGKGFTSFALYRGDYRGRDFAITLPSPL